MRQDRGDLGEDCRPSCGLTFLLGTLAHGDVTQNPYAVQVLGLMRGAAEKLALAQGNPALVCSGIHANLAVEAIVGPLRESLEVDLTCLGKLMQVVDPG